MNRRDVAILVKSAGAKRFLERFFAERKNYRPAFFRDPDPFLTNVLGNSSSALIVELGLLPDVADRITRFPTIAFITGGVTEGIEEAIGLNADCYIFRPYNERDLEYKLEQIILHRETIWHMEGEIRELNAVVELNHTLSQILDPKELLYKVVSKIAEIIPVTRCSMVRVDWLHKSAFVVASYEDPAVAGIRLSLRKYPEIVAALTSKKPVVIKDVLTDPLMRQVRKIIEPLGIRSILVLPVFFQDKVIGTLFLRTSRAIHAFTETEIRLLNTLARASASALHNAYLFEQVEDEKTRLEKLAVTDYLTGIYNIRYFYHRIIEEFSRCQRYDFPISCLMIDVDYFKKINDAYGHKVGDMVLREFAQFLRRLTRKSDVLARYGGEEFIILLPQTGLEGAVAEAERLMKNIKKHHFRSLKNRKGITVSVGVSVHPHEAIKSHDELISTADDALFTAKNRGRNQAAIFGR